MGVEAQNVAPKSQSVRNRARVFTGPRQLARTRYFSNACTRRRMQNGRPTHFTSGEIIHNRTRLQRGKLLPRAISPGSEIFRRLLRRLPSRSKGGRETSPAHHQPSWIRGGGMIMSCTGWHSEICESSSWVPLEGIQS
ncbi:predicted protein [Uncinocarpus reesii 1704]|uniref:Uncharacterized protein n=1 Tax=Uncinocarpus reesii (strain UAMH 1704) TaxID=336963 RepID=C4JLK1_UNCRE|nr:uncharacterized protein UREG_03709 [Uncinocarpus reesii 1704]EEP78863.1 predicted protein [Uncinocarpus reesii 1704]